MENKFIEQLKDVLEKEGDINLSDNFRDYKEWNSLAYLSVIAMIDEEYDIIIEGNDFRQLNTIAELIAEVEKRKA